MSRATVLIDEEGDYLVVEEHKDGVLLWVFEPDQNASVRLHPETVARLVKFLGSPVALGQ